MWDAFTCAGDVLCTTKSSTILRICLAIVKISPVFCALECLYSSKGRSPPRCRPPAVCLVNWGLYFWAARMEVSWYDCFTSSVGCALHEEWEQIWSFDDMLVRLFLFPRTSLVQRSNVAGWTQAALSFIKTAQFLLKSFSLAPFFPYFHLSEKK